jgi:hypothetical protein
MKITFLIEQPLFFDWCVSLLSSCCGYTRTQILVASQAHQDNSTLANQASGGLSKYAHLVFSQL